jgi:hypothetical protein
MRRSTAKAGDLIPQLGPRLGSVRRWLHPIARLRGLLRRPPARVLFRLPATPAVVLACENCGFDYTVTRIETPGGESAIVWSCSCGSRFIPPGGVPTSQLVRP